MIFYYITDREQLGADEPARRRLLLSKIGEAAKANVDYVQLREKDLPVRELQALASAAMAVIRGARLLGSRTRLLINSRSDIALACGADGIHLTSADMAAGDARALWMTVCPGRSPVIGVSCHSVGDVQMAYSQGADFAVLAPIFGKSQTDVPGVGLQVITQACTAFSTRTDFQAPGFHVLALGGVTLANARDCTKAGAAGVAGIRLFQQNLISDLKESLRGSS